MEKKLTLEDHINAIERPVEIIAHVRRMAEDDGEDMEKFDEMLNDLCNKKHEMFAKMGSAALTLYGLKVIFDAGEGEELLKDMLGKDE